MEFTSEHSLTALRTVLEMSLSAIFDGNSLDSMSSEETIRVKHTQCARFLTVVSQFRRQMEPAGILADTIDDVTDRMEWCASQIA